MDHLVLGCCEHCAAARCKVHIHNSISMLRQDPQAPTGRTQPKLQTDRLKVWDTFYDQEIGKLWKTQVFPNVVQTQLTNWTVGGMLLKISHAAMPWFITNLFYKNPSRKRYNGEKERATRAKIFAGSLVLKMLDYGLLIWIIWSFQVISDLVTACSAKALTRLHRPKPGPQVQLHAISCHCHV